MKRRNFLTLAAGASLAVPITALALANRAHQQPQSVDDAPFTLDMFLVNGKPIERPRILTYVFAVIDNPGVVYFGRSRNVGAPQLAILDWENRPVQVASIADRLLSVDWLLDVNKHLGKLTGEGGTTQGSLGTFIEDKGSGAALLQWASMKDLPVRAIDSRLTAIGKEELTLNASSHVAAGSVKITREAYEKGGGHLMSLFDSVSYGVCLALGVR